MALTPAKLAAPNTEHSHQVALFAWAALQHNPMLEWLHAIPNGGERNAIVAGRMKAEGVRTGVFDVFLPVAMGGYHGLYIELKKPDRKQQARGGLSEQQVSFGKFVLNGGYRAEVAYTWVEAANIICSYLGLPCVTSEAETT